jgi:hypothetical protein
MRTRRACALSWLALALLAVPTRVLAHTRSQSFSTWDVRGDDVRAVFSVGAIEVTRLARDAAARAPSGKEGIAGDTSDLAALLREHLETRLTVTRGDAPCPAVAPARALAASSGLLRVEQRFRCSAHGTLHLRNDALFDRAPMHVHTARVRIDDVPAFELLFTEARREHSVVGRAGGADDGTSFGSWLALGVEHIAVGADHVAFLVALLLLCRRWRDFAWLITGFTIGHSATLTLAVLGVVRPNVPVVEALIGFTIALVAAENVAVRTGALRRGIALAVAGALCALACVRLAFGIGLPVATSLGLALFTFAWLPLAASAHETLRLRPLLTLVFGLVHGFGFASVLMEVGLPSGRLASALIGFNVGVEVGQLAIVALLLGPGIAFAQHLSTDSARRFGIELASALLCGLGLFWFVERAFRA